VDTSHQATTLTVQVRVDLLLEGGLVEVTTADTDTESNCLLLGLAGNILEDGDGGVDTTSLTEECSDGTARSLGGNEDDIDVSWDIDLGLVLENWGETVGEVEGLIESAWANKTLFGAAYLSLGDLGLDCWPGLALRSIRKQVHDDGTLGDSLIDLEEGLSWNPAILLSVLPRLSILSYTNNDVETLITHVQGLGVTLGAISDNCHCVVLEELLHRNQYRVRNVRCEVKHTWSFAGGQSALSGDIVSKSIWSELVMTYRRHPPEHQQSQ